MPERADPPETCVRVELGPRAYDVRIVTAQPGELGPFVRRVLNLSWSGSSCRLAMIVTDTHVANLPLVSQCAAALSRVGLETSTAVLPAGEFSKSLASASRLFDELVDRRADRHTTIVGLGGGVIGDIAGFV